MKKIFTRSTLYLVKFLVYGGIAAYGYSENSKYVLVWMLLALMMLAFFIVISIKEEIDEIKTTQNEFQQVEKQIDQNIQNFG